nr:MAG TPA: major tail protein [Caudoviricetes sp.]
MSAALPEALTDAGGALKELPTEYMPLGIFTTDGATKTTDISVEDVEGLGYAGPVRSDLVKAAPSVKLNILEMFRKNILELVHGVDLSQVKADKSTGEIVFDDPSLPVLKEYRLLVIAADGPADDEWLLGWGYPRVKLSSMPDTDLKSSDPIKGALEFKVLTDEDLGTPCRNYIGGTGAIRHLDAIGFEKAA